MSRRTASYKHLLLFVQVLVRIEAFEWMKDQVLYASILADFDSMEMREAVIVDAVRTPVGKYAGILRDVRPDDMAAFIIRKLVERNKVDPSAIDDVYMGCGNQAGEDNRNVARMAVLLSGLPYTVPGVTVNRLCGSGLQAINDAAHNIMVGMADIVIAGGVESMTRAPFVIPKSSGPFVRETKIYDTTLGWRFVNPKMVEEYPPLAMGETAENLAEKYGIKRSEQDEFALQSHRKAVAARKSGRFKEEITAVEVEGEDSESITVAKDEGPRENTSLEALSRLKPVFKPGGTVTAGNSSPISDGAAGVILTSREMCDELRLEARLRVSTNSVAGVHPSYMGMGPVPATKRALAKAKLELEDIDVVEINEAFAAQVLAVLKEMPLDQNKLNPNGGAVALGHPIGCSGARIVTTLLYEMMRRKSRYGLAAMCIGVGQGIATIFERAN